MLYLYNIIAQDEYNSLIADTTNEYKQGMLDPSREVGRIEKGRTQVRKMLKMMSKRAKSSS